MKIGSKTRSELSLQERMSLKQFTLADNLLFYTPRSGAEIQPVRMCIPSSPNNTLRPMVLHECHEIYLHMGIDKTYDGTFEPLLLLASYVERC